jgi:glycosyltransferase involved in cell wall biosynthesis
MRILIVSPWLPHAEIPHAGGQYLFHTAVSLGERGHEVHLLCYGRGEPLEVVRAMRERCAAVEVVTPAYTPREKLRRLWEGGWRRPWTLGRRTHLAMRAEIRRLCSAGLDVVHLAWTEMGRYQDAVPRGTATVLGTLDVEGEVRPREIAWLPWGPRRWGAWFRTRRLVRGERRYVRRAGALLAVSPRDAAALARVRGRDDVHVVPPWLDLPALCAIEPGSAVKGRLTFMGALDRVANRAAVRFLVDEVWPRIRVAHGGATLQVVGVNPPAALCRRAEQDPRFVVTGWVPDLTAVWAASDVALVPSLVGGGLLLKVAQPMAAGRPVVTTTPGNAGVGAPPGAVEVADDPAGLAAAALDLLENRQHWRRLAERGRRHVLATLDWEESMRRLEAAYAAATDRGRPS